jgi:uncharacterized protein (TIGR03083 family)
VDRPAHQLYALATANRLLAADLFDGLSAEQWRTPSLCTGWTVREVAAHLVPPAGGYTRRGLAWQVVRFRGDLDRMVDVTTRREARRPVAELVAALRERAGTELSAPVVGAAGPMADTAIHLRDAARPLGLDVDPGPSAWLPVLDFLVSRPASRGFIPRDRLTGLRLTATDRGWSWGEGTEIRGAGEALALAVAGRQVVLPELDGPGVAVLEQRLRGR